MTDRLIKVEQKRDGLSYLKKNIEVFNSDASNNLDRTKVIFIRTKYWIYDSQKEVFGPSKFIAYENMNFERYEHNSYNGARTTFDGATARKAIEKLLAQNFEQNPSLHNKLCFWAEEITEPELFKNIIESKWRFVVI